MEKIYEIIKKRIGSATIEYSVLLPLLLMISLLALWMIFSIHDRAVLQAIASESARDLASVWRSGSDPYLYTKNGDLNYESQDARNIYWQLETLLSSDIIKAEKIEKHIADKVRLRSWLPSNRLNNTETNKMIVSVKTTGGIPWSRIHVDIQLVKEIPLLKYINKNHSGSQIINRASSSALTSDSKSLIQDMDWAIQTVQKTEASQIYDQVMLPIKTWYKKTQQVVYEK